MKCLHFAVSNFFTGFLYIFLFNFYIFNLSCTCLKFQESFHPKKHILSETNLLEYVIYHQNEKEKELGLESWKNIFIVRKSLSDYASSKTKMCFSVLGQYFRLFSCGIQHTHSLLFFHHSTTNKPRDRDRWER